MENKAIQPIWDFRSDTVTLPTAAMYEAIAKAPVGDDVYQDDPSVNRLEARAAELTGKEAALFVPSGTMGNQIAISCHTKRGDEMIVGANSHIFLHEVGGAALLSGVSSRPVYGEHGVAPEDIATYMWSGDIHEPPTSLVCLENALANGQVVPFAQMQAVYKKAKEHGLAVHLDGARIFNAAIALGVSVKDLAASTDSMMFCVSKGLAAPVGSLLVGQASFIAKARKMRKLLGGGMRQAGILAACGLVALQEENIAQLTVDHANARYLAEQLLTLPGVELDLAKVQINMVFCRLPEKITNHVTTFLDYLKERQIKICPPDRKGIFRLMTNRNIDKEAIDRLVASIQQYLV